MARPASTHPYFLPFMLADLAINAGETIVSRTRLIATGQCTAAEYRRMVLEKAEAVRESSKADLFASTLREAVRVCVEATRPEPEALGDSLLEGQVRHGTP